MTGRTDRKVQKGETYWEFAGDVTSVSEHLSGGQNNTSFICQQAIGVIDFCWQHCQILSCAIGCTKEKTRLDCQKENDDSFIFSWEMIYVIVPCSRWKADQLVLWFYRVHYETQCWSTLLPSRAPYVTCDWKLSIWDIMETLGSYTKRRVHTAHQQMFPVSERFVWEFPSLWFSILLMTGVGRRK